MSDFDMNRYVFITCWTGFEQITTIECDRCGEPVQRWTTNEGLDSISLDRFHFVARTHESVVHGG